MSISKNSDLVVTQLWENLQQPQKDSCQIQRLAGDKDRGFYGIATDKAVRLLLLFSSLSATVFA